MLALLDIEGGGDEGNRGLRVAHGGQLDDGDLRELLGAGGGNRHRQPGLADSSRPADRDDRTVGEHRPHGGDVVGSTDQLGRFTPGQRRPDGARVDARRPKQGRVIGEDLRFQRLRRRGEAETELVAEHRSQLGAPAQRLGLPAEPVERQHQLAPEPLPKGVGGDERFQLGDRPALLARVEPGLDELLRHRQPQLLEAQGLAPHDGQLGELAEGGAAPQAEGPFECRNRLARWRRRRRGPRSGSRRGRRDRRRWRTRRRRRARADRARATAAGGRRGSAAWRGPTREARPPTVPRRGDRR